MMNHALEWVRTRINFKHVLTLESVVRMNLYIQLYIHNISDILVDV